MTDWPVKTLGEVCDLVGGGTPSKDRPEFYGGDIPWATVRDLNVEVLCSTEHSITVEAVKSSSSNVIPAGSVVIATRVGLGKVVILGQDTAINQDLRGLVVRNPNEVLANYLFWWYLSTVHLVVAAGTGATVQGVKLPFVSGLEIPLPPLEEQKRIVALLDAATARVTELSACYELARTHAHNLFTSVLREELEGNPGWPVSVIGDVCELSLGKMLDSKQKTGLNPTPYLRNVNVRWGSFDTRDMASMDIRPEEMERVTARPGDVIVCEGGEPGRCAVWRGPRLVAIQKALHRVRPKNGIDGDYIALFLAFLAEIGELKYFFTGTTIKHIPKEKLHLVPIPVPPLEEQIRIVARLDLMKAKTSEMTVAYDAKLTAAKYLRQSILEAAFAGDM